MTETDHFEAGLATLSSDPKDAFPESAPWKVNGVAIPENTIVNGGQNVDHFFPPETLEGAGELLEGKPIVVDFHDLEGQADASNVIGEVTAAGHQKGVGLVFEGEVVDSDVANKIKHGYLDVSPTPARSLGEFDDSMGAQRVERLADFRDLAVVANGQPGAKVEMGGNPAVEALARDALFQGFDPLANVSDLSEGDLVTWNSSGDRNAYGMVEDVREEGDDDLDSEIDGDVTVSAPAVLIEVHRPGSDGWEATEQMVGHKPGTLDKIDELPDPDTLQANGPSLDDSVDLPERIQNAGEAALEAGENGWIPDSCGTGRGEQRAELGANNDVTVADLLTRENGTPIPAYLNSHEEDLTAEGPPTKWGEEEWSDCGNAGIGRWLYYVDWFKEKANELAEARGEEPPYDAMGSDTLQSDMKSVAGVRFQGTREGELDESEIDKDETDLSDHYLYGEGENKEDFSYPVVDAEGFLRKGNVEAAHSLGCRGMCPDAETHDENMMDLAGEFDDPPEFAQGDTMSSDMDMLETDGDITVNQFREFARQVRDMDDTDPQWANSVEALAQQAANLQTIMKSMVEHHRTMHGMEVNPQASHPDKDDTMSVVNEIEVEETPNEVDVITQD